MSSSERAKKVVREYCDKTGFLTPQSEAAVTLETLISVALEQHLSDASQSDRHTFKQSALAEFETRFADYIGDDDLENDVGE